MDCFTNIVALKELCDPQTPFSGIYLNDIAVTKQYIESIITKDVDSIQDFVDGKINQAVRITQSLLMGKISPYVKPGSLIEGHRIGYTEKNLVSKPSVSGNLVGIAQSLNNSSVYLDYSLSSISLQLTQDVTGVEIFVYDLLQGKLLDTFTIDAVANEIVTIYPQKTYSCDARPMSLFIGYSATSFQQDSIYTTASNGQCCGVYSITNSFMTANGAKISEAGEIIDLNLVQIPHTSGLSVVYSLSCNMKGWMCQFAQSLALPIAYKTAAEIDLHAINNSLNYRSSNNANVNTHAIMKRYEWYEAQFKLHLEGILSNMVIPSGNPCFICQSPNRNVIAIP